MYEDDLEDDVSRYEDDGYTNPESEDEDAEEIEPEETLEELDIDERGHVRPRRRGSRFDEYTEDVFDTEDSANY